jgi:hypothetical protein
MDSQYVNQFAARVREMFPGCPPGREVAIAEHACQKYSGRVGRSAAAKSLDAEAVRLAVVAHIRHMETNYDELLMHGAERYEARDRVKIKIYDVMTRWIEPG